MFIHRAGVVACLALLVSCGSEEPGPEGAAALERLGVAESDARRYAVDSLASGEPYGLVASAGKAFRAMDDDDRVDAIGAVARWAQAYFESDAFRAAYAEHRAASKPTPIEYPESVDQEVARRTRESLQQIVDSRNRVVPMLPEADRAEMLENLDAMKTQLEDPAFAAMQRQGIEMQRAEDQRRFEEALTRWQSELPEDPDELVKRRLQTFLDTCGDVDFDAELEERYGKLRFTDSEYERKPWEWKLCFRAGEDSVEAAREAATDWLDELS